MYSDSIWAACSGVGWDLACAAAVSFFPQPASAHKQHPKSMTSPFMEIISISEHRQSFLVQQDWALHLVGS
jgi:hypothetical protein